MAVFALAGPAAGGKPAHHRVDSVIVKLDAAHAARASAMPEDDLPVGLPELDAFCERHGIRQGHRLAGHGGAGEPAAFARVGLDRTYLLRLPASGTARIESLIGELRKLPWVEYAEPNYVYEPTTTTPNDPLFTLQWHHDNAGQTGGTPDADIDSPQAWDIGTGDPSVLIAVIDSGVDANHLDLVDNLILGVDFTDSPEGIDDVISHGTQVAGLAAARGNNALGVAGVCWNCSILPLKIFGSAGFPTSLEEIVPAVVYAVDQGSAVINMSFGGGGWSQAFLDAVDYGLAAGALSVAGSGNSGTYGPFVPAAFHNTVSVAGTDSTDMRYGNYGDHAEVAAPTDVYTTRPGAVYGEFGGTSAASPIAAGLAALLRSVDPNLHVTELRQLLRLGAEDQIGNPTEDTPGWDGFLGYGRVNANASLLLIDGPWLALDRPHYVCEGELFVDLKDKTATTSVAVSLSGDLSGDTETVTVMPVNTHGYYRGSIALEPSSSRRAAVPQDGILEVADGESITATVADLTATATADCSKRVCLLDPSPAPVSGDCDADGVLDPGETWIVEPTLENAQTELFVNAEVTVTADGMYVELPEPTHANSALNPIDPWNPSIPIRLLPGGPAAQRVSFSLDISGDGWVADVMECQAQGAPPVFSLVANRDGTEPDSWPATAPADLTGSGGGCPGVFGLSWDPVPGAEGYSIYRSDTSCEDALVDGAAYGTTMLPAFVDSAPTQSSPSFYAVAATEAGTGCTTVRACIRGSCCPVPDDPGGLRLQPAGDDIELTWDDPATGSLVWNVFRAPVADPSEWGPPLHAGVGDGEPDIPGVQQVDVGAMTAGSPLYYLVTADDGCGESPLF